MPIEVPSGIITIRFFTGFTGAEVCPEEPKTTAVINKKNAKNLFMILLIFVLFLRFAKVLFYEKTHDFYLSLRS